jgi:hypothetical protein
MWNWITRVVVDARIHNHRLSRATFLLWAVTTGAVLHREEDATTAEVRNMNMSGVGIALEIADHPHVVMESVKMNTTQDIVNEVETGVGNGATIRRMDMKRVKSASRNSLGHNSLLIITLQAEEGQV